MRQTDERMNNVARKLFPYDRFSDDMQQAGSSAERQAEMIRSVAAEYKAEIDDSYALSDHGVSGFRGLNVKKKLGLFISLCKEGVVRKGDFLCIERVNRLSRMKWTEQVKLWEEILSYGVVIVTCEPRGEYTAKNIGKLEQGCSLAILMMLGNQESEQKSQWIAYAHKVSRERAMADGSPHGKHCPAWLRGVGRPHPHNPKRRITERWEKIPERVELVRRIHQMAWDGHGIEEIRHQLENEGIRHWSKRGTWTLGAVAHLLKTRTLIGWVEPNKHNYKCNLNRPAAYRNYPPILTDAEYERTQLALASRWKKGGRKTVRQFNLFAGLLWTREKEPIYLRYSIGYSGKRYPFLAPQPQTLRVPYQLFEDAILASLRQLKATDIDGSLRADEWSEKTLQLQAESARHRLALDTLKGQLDSLPAERWPSLIVEKVGELADALKATEAALTQAKLYGSTSARVETLADTQSILDYLSGLTDPVERRAALERIKTRLPIILESITIATERGPGLNKWVHLKIAYKGGHVDRISLRIGIPSPPSPCFCGDW